MNDFDSAAILALKDFEWEGRPLATVLSEDFIAVGARLLEDIECSVSAAEIARLAHVLRSSSLTLGLIKLAGLCGQVEQAGLGEDSMAPLRGAFQEACTWLKGQSIGAGPGRTGSNAFD